MTLTGDLLLGFLLGVVTTLVVSALNRTLMAALRQSPGGCCGIILFLAIALALAVAFGFLQVQL